ncbi:MAG: hypothetical protein GXO10_01460 [Crenarchaeota archaeon]|nr:hypothetical protein [Thermoproteota archaeon]
MQNETMSIATTLRREMERIARDEQVDAVVLSGGLDSSVTAYLLRHCDPTGITVIYSENPGKDEYYSLKLSTHLSIRHIILKINTRIALEKIPIIIRILRSFSPMEIPNDIPITVALEYVKNMGMRRVATGDGGDELFCGYSYMTKMSETELEEYVKKLPKFWYFPSLTIARELGVEAVSMFLKEPIVKLALSIPVKYKLVRDREKIITKYILRLAFHDVLPEEIVWRLKEPLEYGSGFTYIRRIISSLISDDEYRAETERIRQNDGVIIQSKEQLYYYRIYRIFYRPPRDYAETDLNCPYCGADLNPHNPRYCYVCGAYISDCSRRL